MRNDIEFNDLVHTRIRETIQRLQEPVSDEVELLALLAAPLDALGILPPPFRTFNSHPFDTKGTFDVYKLVPQIQTAILRNVAPAWLQSLQERNRHEILYQYFSPDLFSSSSKIAIDIALCAYGTTLSTSLQPVSIELIRRLSKTYPIDKLFLGLFSASSSCVSHRKLTVWEDHVRDFFAAPTKVANFVKDGEIPVELGRREYFSNVSIAVERLVYSLPENIPTTSLSALTIIFSKMVNLGLFTRNRITESTMEPGFFAVLPRIRDRLSQLNSDKQSIYSSAWSTIWSSLPPAQLSKVIEALFANLTGLPDVLSTSSEARSLVKREARLVSLLMGYLEDEDDGKWTAISSSLLSRNFVAENARIIVCWAAISDEYVIPKRALESLLDKTLDIWSSPEHIKHSLLSQHQALTLAFLLAATAFKKGAESIQALSHSPAFIQAIGVYLTHLDPAVRRCGMLVAEIVAKQTGRTLDFGDWEREGEGREWCKAVRALITSRDVDAEDASWIIERLEIPGIDDTGSSIKEGPENVKKSLTTSKPIIEVLNSGYDSDDSLEGYASPSSSRAASPTPSEMEEVEKDPTLNVGVKKIQKPVYLADLGIMLQASAKSDDPQAVDRIEVALGCAEDLIRRKRNFGLELDENAVNLTHALVGLQNNFELENFDERRQAAVTALVACCPRKAAPTIVEQFFGSQYSTEQRFVMLTALAMGARELASLPVPPPTYDRPSIDFPSRQLPAPLHRKYLTDREHDPTAQVRQLVDNISQAAAQSGKEAAEAKVPQIIRERQLRLKKGSKVEEVQTSNNKSQLAVRDSRKQTGDTFTSVAAEYFLGPIIAKFWQHLRDEQTREERTALRSSTSSYRGAGTGLVLNPLVLSQLVNTLAILVHAARHSPAYLAIVAPDALELAVTVGSRPMANAEESKEREAVVLTASLELALVVLDGCLDLDGGRSIGLERTSLLLATGEWAGQVLKLLEDGVRVPGEGGVQELRLRRSAAGLVLKVDELASRWRQSMITI
ncbi:hypothetical protein SCHPADRAFT_965696 [Schizopora paradoxa]|uniref:Telomere length regulation protein conserved domain-containing protein n=1 Tax=Schizopora paradoxa TaxID=27342 RepID=A0A0H2RYK3_9AGAM|nr:hypothetical protein SCHPADRAFT_965696 [Schizopora paradoxa]